MFFAPPGSHHAKAEMMKTGQVHFIQLKGGGIYWLYGQNIPIKFICIDHLVRFRKKVGISRSSVFSARG